MNMDEIDIPALGRPFELGMLYDCRTNNLINRKIWNEKSIELHTVSYPQPQCDFDFTADDTISSKTSFLEISADIKLSLLLGWVEVHGSAEYLKNHKTFTRQSRASFKYRCRTHFKELKIKELMSKRKIGRGILNSEIATHMVVGILYGIDAIFVFDRNTTGDEDTLEINTKLEAMVKFFPKASTSSNDEERKNKTLDNVTYTYHGDIQLDSEPASFEEAFRIYKTLPSKIGQRGEKCVPMTVWLYPLRKLQNKKSTFDRLLDVTLVNQVQNEFEKIQVLKMKCNDLAVRSTCEYDERYRQKIDEFQAKVEQSEQNLKSQLSKTVTALLPKDLVRQNVGHILDEYENSPVSPEKLDNNLSEIRTVINVLDTCVRQLQPVTKDIRFKFPPNENFFGDQNEDEFNNQSSSGAQRRQRFKSNFSSMRKAIKEDKHMFISKYSEKEKSYNKQSFVQHDEDNELLISFRPDKPSVIRLNTNTIQIMLQVPRKVTGDFFYEFSYRCVDDEIWKILRTETVGIERAHGPILKCNTQYVFRVRCIFHGEFKEYSEVSDVFQIEHNENSDIWSWFIFTKI